MRKLLVAAKNVHVIRDFCKRTLVKEASKELAADLQHDLDVVLLVAYHTKAMPELLHARAEYNPDRGKVEVSLVDQTGAAVSLDPVAADGPTVALSWPQTA